jgi:thiol-disulfide isomerase/thioredoxin
MTNAIFYTRIHIMKKNLLFVCLLALSASVAAQLPNGSIAPNFNAKDINGRTWNLYDILESGRPVIMDVSATWCGPCWSYHNSHALENYFEAHGPEGDAKSMVFFIEGDGATNTNCLYGPSGCNDATQGNWVAGTPYPIIDNATIANAYDVNAFPTILLICPDKTLTELGQINANALWTNASQCVGDVPARAAKVQALQHGALATEMCGPKNAEPKVQMINLGTEEILTAEVELRFNGALLQSKSFSGDVPVFGLFEVGFDALSIDGSGILSAQVVKINGQDATAMTPAEVVFTDAEQKYTGQDIVLHLKTDYNAKDIFWAIYDDAGNEIKHGGNEQVGPNGGGLFPAGSPDDPSAYANNIWVRDTFQLPQAGCFSFRMVDGAGNGITPPGLFRLFQLGSTTAFYLKTGNFGGLDSHTFAPLTSGVEDLAGESLSMKLFPNPASTQLQIALTNRRAGNCQVQLTDATGRVQRSRQLDLPLGEQLLDLDLSGLAAGLYFVQVRTEAGMRTERVVVE